MKNVIIIDALNMFLRSYVVSPHMDKNGIPVGGTIGFLKSLQKVARDFNADEVIVAWDGHEGSTRKRSMNKDYKAGRKPVRFNRRMIELPPEQEMANKGYQQVRLMEYLNEMPVIQLVADFTEADDIIAHVINHKNYNGWMKTIISSDKDFFQLCRPDVQIYRPIQKKIVTEASVVEEFKIHPKNFALARAMAGDPSDNLPGIKGAGLKTIAKRFPYLIREDEYEVGDIVRDCVMVGKKLKIHENIQKDEQLIKENYKIMQLQYPNIRPMNRELITKAVIDFEPTFNKIKFTQMLFADDAGHLNFDALQMTFRKINRQ
jgi:5'-3' exonuclease